MNLFNSTGKDAASLQYTFAITAPLTKPSLANIKIELGLELESFFVTSNVELYRLVLTAADLTSATPKVRVGGEVKVGIGANNSHVLRFAVYAGYEGLQEKPPRHRLDVGARLVHGWLPDAGDGYVSVMSGAANIQLEGGKLFSQYNMTRADFEGLAFVSFPTTNGAGGGGGGAAVSVSQQLRVLVHFEPAWKDYFVRLEGTTVANLTALFGMAVGKGTCSR